jgi:hypothetical protein
MIMIICTFWEHLHNLQKVLQRFCEAHLKLNPEKCHFFQKKIQYVGHIVSWEGITTDLEKLKAMRERLTPRNEHEIRSSWAYVPTKGGLSSVSPTSWSHWLDTQRRNKHFSGPQNERPSSSHWRRPTVLHPSLFTRQEKEAHHWHTNNVGIGVMSQVQDGQEQVIAYCRKTLNKANRIDCESYKSSWGQWNISWSISVDRSSTCTRTTSR